MAAPAFGVLEVAGHFADGARHVVHDAQVGIHALREVEPFFLRSVRGKSAAFVFVDAGGVDEKFGNDQCVELAAKAVRKGVVNRDFAFDLFARGDGAEVGHAAGEGGGDGEARGVDVVFHVILRRRDEENRGGDFANDGGEFAHEENGVNNFEVVAD